MIKRISSKVACFLCKDEDCQDSYDLYEYAVYIILSSAFHIATIIALGLCFNLLVESIVFYFSFIAIRKFAGGYHAKKSNRCYIISTVSSIIVLVLIKIILICNFKFIEYLLLLLGMFCVIVICYLSPLDTVKNPLNHKEKIVFKIISIVSSVTIFFMSCLLITFSVFNIGISMIFGVFMSSLVLALRKATENH
ncbi:MAG: accessory gene regulator B family protein [Ruminococcus sp.]|nr:accessory gene regulator B family protein [Ruminococcus sp.]